MNTLLCPFGSLCASLAKQDQSVAHPDKAVDSVYCGELKVQAEKVKGQDADDIDLKREEHFLHLFVFLTFHDLIGVHERTYMVAGQSKI